MPKCSKCGKPITSTIVTCEGCQNVVHKSNADRIRAMSDEELAQLLCTADWCEECDQTRQNGTCAAMELEGPLCKHCVAAGLRWLQNPAVEVTP